MKPIIVSACLLGLKTRYDGQSKADPFILSLARKKLLLPLCPEQLGGLATPRWPAEIIGGDGFDVLKGQARVLNITGEDVTTNFLRGAQEVERILHLFQVKQAILKSKSPSCGLSPKTGVTAALLLSQGIKIEEWG